MSLKTVAIFKLRWIHISPISDEDIGYLEQNFRFHNLDLKDCREGVQRPKLDIYKHYLFMIFHFPMFNKQTRRVGIQSLNVFLGEDYLITATNDRDHFLERYFNRFRKSGKRSLHYDPFKNNASYLLYKIIDIMYHRTLPVINEIGVYLSEVEEEVYSHKNKDATTNLSIIRRNILNLRRILEPQLKMVDRLVHMKASFFSEKLSVYYDDVHDYLENMWAALGNYKDTLDGLFNTNESFINQRTNEVIKTLTVISVALLPMTLVASIYGMNVTNLPLADHPIGIWVILFILASIVLASIYFAKRKKII
ncbi:magnesium transporter CorA family protein [Patescibacteria group bacterium]|nr:magnesium transporter CorA family protein [Patescibacteria group bacterium]MBU0964418.1 magnesium transporter CorA family protein [Patescibacteria group bacterium]